jgi:hypothetical protein
MEWVDVLRLITVAALAYGAWRTFRNRPPVRTLHGRRYYRQPDGSYRTIWGGRVKNAATIAELDRLSDEKQEGAHQT